MGQGNGGEDHVSPLRRDRQNSFEERFGERYQQRDRYDDGYDERYRERTSIARQMWQKGGFPSDPLPVPKVMGSTHTKVFVVSPEEREPPVGRLEMYEMSGSERY